MPTDQEVFVTEELVTHIFKVSLRKVKNAADTSGIFEPNERDLEKAMNILEGIKTACDYLIFSAVGSDCEHENMGDRLQALYENTAREVERGHRYRLEI